MPKIKEFLNKLPFKLNPYVIAVVVLAVIIILSLTGRRSQEDTFDKFIEAYSNLDAEAIVELMPDEYIEELIDKGKIDNRRDMARIVQSALDYQFEYYYDEDTWSYSYEIVSERSAKKGDNDQTYDEVLRNFGEHGDGIKEVVIISFDPTITYMNYDDEMDEKPLNRSYVHLVKIGQSWYIAEFHDIWNWV